MVGGRRQPPISPARTNLMFLFIISKPINDVCPMCSGAYPDKNACARHRMLKKLMDVIRNTYSNMAYDPAIMMNVLDLQKIIQLPAN